MTPPRPEQPATAAGRALLAWDTAADDDADEAIRTLLGRHWQFRDAILAIEREAAAAALPDVAELARALATVELRDGTYHLGVPTEAEFELARDILREIERARG